MTVDTRTSNVRGSATELRHAVELMQPIYDKSKRRLDGEDAEWEERKKFLEKKMFALVKSFSDSDPSSKAVFILGQLVAIAQELDQPRMNVLQFEVLHDRYLRAVNGK